jgi:hypothetical protein
MIPGQDQDVLAGKLSKDVEILADGVGGALEPGLNCGCLLRREDLHVSAGERIEPVGATDVTVEGHRIELRQDIHPFHAGVDGVRYRDIDEPVLPCNRHRGLAAAKGEWGQSRAPSTAENQYSDIHIALLDRIEFLPPPV